jgi:hypothetical protein
MSFGFNGSSLPWHLDYDAECGWCVIRDAQYRYVSDACVEGTPEEMRAIATAIRAGESISFKRCRALREGDFYAFSSPRNTMGKAARLPMQQALELAVAIDGALAKEGRVVMGPTWIIVVVRLDNEIEFFEFRVQDDAQHKYDELRKTPHRHAYLAAARSESHA